MRRKIQEPGKIKSLLKQFTFLKTFVGEFDQDDNVVNIIVKVADIQLLSLTPKEYDGINNYVASGSLKAKVSQRVITEYTNPIGPKKNITFSAWDGLSCDIYNIVKLMYNVDLTNVKSITIVTKYEWYEQNDKHLEDKVHEDLYFTVYTIPKIGLHQLMANANIINNVVIDSKDFIDKDIICNFDLFSKLAENFMFGAYLRGLRDYIIKNDTDCFEFKSVRIVSQISDDSEKIFFIITKEKYSITFVANYRDDNPKMKCHSIMGTLPELKIMVDEAIKYVKETNL